MKECVVRTVQTILTCVLAAAGLGITSAPGSGAASADAAQRGQPRAHASARHLAALIRPTAELILSRCLQEP
jgi:glycine/D-amino acid oxidase-like deaminating enzyme